VTRIGFLQGEAPSGGALYRALRTDVRFPLVALGAGDEYELVREEGDVDGRGGVLLITPFEVPGDRDERFLSAWDAARRPLERCQGFLGRRAYRNVGSAALRFVDIGRWSSPLMHQRALAIPEVYEAIEAIDFPSHPALYLPAE
jgi:hypothetical protein